MLNFVKIGSDLDIGLIYIFVRFKVNGAPKSLYILRFARNLAQRTELSQERCVLSFVKIGSDFDIVPTYVQYTPSGEGYHIVGPVRLYYFLH